MVVKTTDEKHFTLPLGGGSSSNRVILPGRDPARVKVTLFTGAAGQKFEDVYYPVDETVHLISGRAIIRTQGDKTDMWKVEAGTTYHLPAGEKYSLECITEVTGFCVFSQAADGTLPTDEPNPK